MNINFESFYYAININIILSFIVFSDFNYIFLLIVSINEIIFLYKKIG